MRYKAKDLDRDSTHKTSLMVMRSKPFRSKNRAFNPIADRLVDSGCTAHKDTIMWFLTNTATSIKHSYKGYSFKLTEGYWTGNICSITYTSVKRLTDWLETNDYIDIYIGYKEWWGESGKGFPSMLLFKPKTYELFKDTNLSMLAKKRLLEVNDMVEVIDRETKERLPTRNIKGITLERSVMERINNYIASVNISYDEEPLPNIYYIRKFSDDDTKGGRLYADGGGIQLLPQDLRKSKLKIENKGVVELDYSSIHPNIMYEFASQDVDFPLRKLLGDDFKPYDIDTDFMLVDNKAIEEFKVKHNKPDYDPVRNVCKMALLISLNAKNLFTAQGAMREEMFHDSRKKHEADRKYVGVRCELATLCDNILDHNYMIEDKFFCDQGIFLQNVDSRIALYVIDMMNQRGETALPWHDSFITRESAKQLLNDIMYDAWGHILGSNEFCKVEEK